MKTPQLWKNPSSGASILGEVRAAGADAITIIELKDTAGASALGQLLMYKQLYLQQFKPTKPVELLLIANYKGFDLDAVMANYEVRLMLFPPTTK